MPAKYYEKPMGKSHESIGSVRLGISVPFLVMGAADEDEVDEVIAGEEGAPETRAGLIRDRWQVREVIDGNVWEGEVSYVPSGQGFVGAELGSREFSFDTTGETIKIYSGQEVGIYQPAGTEDFTPDSLLTFEGAINVKQDKVGSEVEGTEIISPVFKFTVDAYFAAEDMTEAYVEKLYKYTGTVNDETVTMTVDGLTFTFEAGELLFVGATGGKRRDLGDWHIQGRFAAQENVTVENPIVFGSGDRIITVTSKQGWDYLWVQYKESSTDKSLIKRAKCAIINRVYPRRNLNELNFPTPLPPEP